MLKHLVAFPHETPEGLYSWRIVDESGNLYESGVGSFGELPFTSNREIVLVIPGGNVQTTISRAATRSEKQLRSAAPYIVEENLASEPEDVHIAISTKSKNRTERAFWVTQSALLQEYLDLANSENVSVIKMIADHMIVPASESRISVLSVGDVWLLRYGLWSAAVDFAFGEEFLHNVISEIKASAASLAFNGDVSLEQVYESEDPYALLAHHAVSSRETLLQGNFQLQRKGAGKLVEASEWQFPIAATVVAWFAMVILLTAEGLQYKEKVKETRQQTVALFKQAFPDIQRVVDVRRQLRAKLASGDGQASKFLELNSLLASAVDQTEGIEIISIRFEQQQNQLQVNVGFSSFQNMQKLVESIKSSGGRVEEGGSRQSGDQRVGLITVTS